MTTATDGDLRLLCRVIRANPEDDTARLVLADRYDELGGGSVPCPKCGGTGSHGLNPYELVHRYGTGRASQMLDALKCGVCAGTGSVPDRTCAARAELIRVQCEMANAIRHHDSQRPVRPYSAHIGRLHDRESALLSEFADAWRRGGACRKCGGRGWTEYPEFTHTVREVCPTCHGTGDSGGLLRPWTMDDRHDAGLLKGEDRYRYAVAYHRGMKRVAVPSLSECVMQCDRCDGDGMAHGSDRPFEGPPGPCPKCNGARVAPSPWLAAVARWHPDVEAVEVLDRVPHEFDGGSDLPTVRMPDFDLKPPYFIFQWYGGESHTEPHRIPRELMLCLYPLVPDNRKWHRASEETTNCYFPTAELARRALARAVALWMFGEVLT